MGTPRNGVLSFEPGLFLLQKDGGPRGLGIVQMLEHAKSPTLDLQCSACEGKSFSRFKVLLHRAGPAAIPRPGNRNWDWSGPEVRWLEEVTGSESGMFGFVHTGHLRCSMSTRGNV